MNRKTQLTSNRHPIEPNQPTANRQIASWMAGARQLRSGFPPRADFDGGGRQRFLFFAKADSAHMVGFYVFQVRGSCVCLSAI